MASEGVKRKISAILSADVAGYSKLMETDEETTVRTMESYRRSISSLIEQHNGRVVDSPGDNLLAEFGSVVDAVQCAVEVQHVIRAKNAVAPEARRMQFRIGISLEDVIEEGDRIYGDGVNIASRIEGMADPGGICISGAAYEQIKRKLALGYEDLGERSVKNISWPVQVYRIPLDSGVATDTKKDTAASFPEDPSIAVLPFVNMSNDPDNEYFSDGVSDDIINSLVKTNALPVIARTSSYQYKDKNLNVQKIASELNVTHIIEGSVRKVGNNVRVIAQLINASTGIHLWSENYDRELTNILALQDEIAAAIVEEIRNRVGLVASEEPGLRTQAVNEEAYDLYLKAQERSYRYDPSRKDAIGLFEKAVEIDPGFADAWIGLANAYMDPLIGMIPKEAASLAEGALQRALDIELDNAMALSRLGSIKANIEYKWSEGSALMERAVQLSPQNAHIRMIYARYLGSTNQPGFLEEVEKAYRLDPLSPDAIQEYASSLQGIGRQIDAQRIMESYMATAEEVNNVLLAWIYGQTRNWEMIEQQYEKIKAIWGADHSYAKRVEYGLAKSRGDATFSNSIEQELMRRMENEPIPFNGFGSAENLKRRYQLAYQQRQFYLSMFVLGNKPSQFTDKEWQNLRERMNIAELGDKSLPNIRSRTKAEANALLERQIELDPSVMDRYVGVYGLHSSGFGYSREIYKKGAELWIESQAFGRPMKMIAVSENQFEVLERKEMQLRFFEPGTHEYDLEITDGQITDYCRRIDK